MAGKKRAQATSSKRSSSQKTRGGQRAPRPQSVTSANGIVSGNSSSGSDSERLIAELQAKGVTRAKIGGFDLDGVLRGKYVSLKKLESALRGGFGFCDVIFGWDIADVLYDNANVTGWHTGYPDVHAVLDAATLRIIPWEPEVVALLADFRDDKGNAHPACPRSLLRGVIERARAEDLEPMVGVEFEFFFFRETRDTLSQKGFRGLTPLDPGMFGYSWLRTGQDAALMSDIFEGLKDFGIALEGLHTETGPGVYEAAITATDALSVADQAALFKTALKEIAHRHGLCVTFMAKFNENLPGSSGHIHQSLWRGGKNVFFDAKAKRGMSSLMQHFIGGQIRLMRELTALYSPTINSYKRYVPGVWAPLSASWGVENRTCAIRVIGLGEPKAQRIEYRQTAADINPYVAIATTLAAGLWGIENRIELPEESVGDAGNPAELSLPRSLAEANGLLAKSKVAKKILGSEFVDHYVRTRDWEVRQAERAVTDWELKRYFESI